MEKVYYGIQYKGMSKHELYLLTWIIPTHPRKFLSVCFLVYYIWELIIEALVKAEASCAYNQIHLLVTISCCFPYLITYFSIVFFFFLSELVRVIKDCSFNFLLKPIWNVNQKVSFVI